MGVEYKHDKSSSSDNVVLVDALCEGISTFIARANDSIDGILILIDEADKPAETAQLGEFCKLFTERMTKLRCEKVCIGIAGLPTLVNKLRSESRIPRPEYLKPFRLNP